MASLAGDAHRRVPERAGRVSVQFVQTRHSIGAVGRDHRQSTWSQYSAHLRKGPATISHVIEHARAQDAIEHGRLERHGLGIGADQLWSRLETGPSTPRRLEHARHEVQADRDDPASCQTRLPLA